MNYVSTRIILGGLYNEYHMTRYYWDFIKIYQKIMLVLILQYFDQRHISKGCLCIIVMLVYIFLFDKMAPFVKIQFTKLEE